MSENQAIPGHHVSDENEPVKPSSYTIDSAATREETQDFKSALYTGTKLAIGLVKESSDAFTPLKSVAAGLYAVLSYYDVRYLHTPRHAYH